MIAVDGPAAAGKGTLARRLARELELAYLETGLLYRAVGRRVLDAGQRPDDPAAAETAAAAVRAADLTCPDLREERVGEAASQVAAFPQVRRTLLEMQRRFGREPPGGARGAVLDGRDIGTVVCPDATVKLFLTAGAEERARRRHRELLDRGEASIYARVLADVIARDERDSRRAVAPLRPADDAFVIDTTGLDADATFALALRHVSSVAGLRA